MLITNAKHGLVFKYRDIQMQDGKWYAWFDKPINDVAESLEALQGDE